MSAGAALDGIDDRDIPKMELLTAAFNSDIEKIDHLMRNGQVHIDSTDDDDVTALHIAAAMGNNYLVRRLLDYGANIDACNQLGMTAFHHAAREGRLAVIDTLLQRGAQYRRLTSLGVNALTLAAAGGHTDVVKKLLSLRDENWRSAPRNRSLAPTPLIAAVCCKSSQICNYLIRAGAAIDETIDTLMGLSALSTAILCTPGVYMVTSLLDLGANQGKRSLGRYNAMELAKTYRRKDIQNVLYEKRAPRNKLESQYDVRRLIMEDKIVERVVDQPTQDGSTLLMFATIVRSVTSVKHLLSKDFDVNAKDNMHISALQIASLLRFDEFVAILLSKNANTMDFNKYGQTAYDLFLLSNDILECSSLRSQLHCHRPMPVDSKFHLSSSTSGLQKPKEWLNKMSSQIFLTTEKQQDPIEPKHWFDAIVKYQSAKDRNACKFASVEEILRCTRTARPPETNNYDMLTEAMRGFMEETQSFLATCFCDVYGEKEEQQRVSGQSMHHTFSEFYDIAQVHAHGSGYPQPRRFPRNSLNIRRKDSIDSNGSMSRKPRAFSSMIEAPSQNQMRTTPRMLKKRETESSRAPPSNTVPTVRVKSQIDEVIWNQFVIRNQTELMKKLKEEEIDHHTFMGLTAQSLREMRIYTNESWTVIQEIQRAMKGLFNPVQHSTL